MPQPNKIPKAFAASGDKNTIPESTETIGLASWNEGFPAITSTPFAEGGLAPKRNDFNGIFYALSAATVWQQQGGFYAYDNNTDYEVGNVVDYNNDLYKCLTANGPSSAVKAPTDATVWSKVMTAADTAAAYLPLSGGTLRGNLNFSTTSTYIEKTNTNGTLAIYAGNNIGTGAEIVLYGKDYASSPGEFQIRAKDGINSKVLRGYPNGTLTWVGKNIAVVDSVDTTTNGYIRFTNGLQIVWARPVIPSGSSQTGIAVTYEKPFSLGPFIYTTVSFNAAYGFGYAVQPINRTATGCTFIIGSSSGGTTQKFTNGAFCYLAIGPWA